MKHSNLLYWLCTGLLAALMTFSAVPNVLMHPEAVTMFRYLGYPTYLLPFLGVAKLLGVVALLVPGFPRLREWAYAGFNFDLIGAMYSGLAVGDPLLQWLPVGLGLALIAASYALNARRDSRLRSQPARPSMAYAA